MMPAIRSPDVGIAGMSTDEQVLELQQLLSSSLLPMQTSERQMLQGELTRLERLQAAATAPAVIEESTQTPQPAPAAIEEASPPAAAAKAAPASLEEPQVWVGRGVVVTNNALYVRSDIFQDTSWRRTYNGKPAPFVEASVVSCNDEGCWVSEVPAAVATASGASDPTARSRVEDSRPAAAGKVVPTKERKVAPQGLFAPVVLATAEVMGRKELNKLRADVIAKHTKVINAFVDTSESRFGQIVLRQMFEAADKDDNGTLDREEVREALKALGFTFIQNKQLDKIMDRADLDNNEVTDHEPRLAPRAVSDPESNRL